MSPRTSARRWSAARRPCGGVPLRVAFTALLIGIVAVGYQIATGIGTWGLNKTVGWAFDITNFVFWVGIGHAGTLISAVLFLFRQKWRTAVNRSAEAMTLFAVMCAGIFPLIHMGRPWLAFWMLPYPNTRGPLWVNFKSPLLWDVFAISTYLLISAVFWYVGLLPDLATVRDRSQPGWRKRLPRCFAWVGMGRARTWHRYETVYMLLAGLATPLVFSVHTIVSMDFATAVIPGWHTTIFPPYFVAGAIFSGLAMVLTLMIIARKVMQLEDYITHTAHRPHVQTDAVDGMHRRTGVRHGVLHGRFQRQWLRTIRVQESCAGAVRLGLLDDGDVQCPYSAGTLVSARASDLAGRLCDRDFCQRRHVVRAVRDHCDQLASRLPAVELGGLHADLHRNRHAVGSLWSVLHLLSCFLPIRAGDRHCRNQRRRCNLQRRQPDRTASEEKAA